MEKLSKSMLLEHLSNYRAASDKVVEDIYELSEKILPIISELMVKPDKTEFEQQIANKLSALTEKFIVASLNAHDYNRSVWKDYKKVINALDSSNEERKDG
ncbi:hypothetical protein [Enterobacter cancerogenus]|uniref:hypothetical protein n=1 Tax=Enterobacter cancerogenus TaxID=69218 RepID=UPI0028B44A26|nr:hypothetical protein [Enterobacter cancerogenus]MDT7011996.1 hypothetical protein [Enterobacter cancerogenus]WNN55090.1 hypothetical protein RIN64_12335 [Enterobacter cancerogenus]